MLQYQQKSKVYIMTFLNDRIDVINTQTLYFERGFRDIDTENYLSKSYMNSYLVAMPQQAKSHIVLPIVFTSGIVRFTIYCPEDVMILPGTVICSIFPIVSSFEKIQPQPIELH